MKLNLDCMRDILLYMEKTDYLQSLEMSRVYAELLSYPQSEINYSLLKLEEAGFIKMSFTPYEENILFISLDDITYEGHQFLANIRENRIWNGVKEIAGKIGATSLDAIVQIASNVVTELIKAYFSPAFPTA